jgi:hypothetical protein
MNYGQGCNGGSSAGCRDSCSSTCPVAELMAGRFVLFWQSKGMIGLSLA